MSKPPSLSDSVEELQTLLVSYATGGRDQSADAEYKQLRKNLLAETLVSKSLPEFIRSCRDLAQFWPFIKNQFGTYAERREFLWNEFRPLLEALEEQERSPADRAVTDTLRNFDPDSIHDVWQRALARRIEDPEGAITLARTLLEAVCKFILDERQVPYDEGAKLPKLYFLTAEALKLAPSQHSEPVFKQVLGGCTAVVGGLGALRSRLGDAHGRGRSGVKPSARHAHLAVNLAGAMATYLVETLRAQELVSASART